MAESTEPRAVIVRSVPIELAQFIKFAGLAESGGEAKNAVTEGLVQVNGVTEMQRGKKLQAGDQVTFRGETLIVVSEAGSIQKP